MGAKTSVSALKIDHSWTTKMLQSVIVIWSPSIQFNSIKCRSYKKQKVTTEVALSNGADKASDMLRV